MRSVKLENHVVKVEERALQPAGKCLPNARTLHLTLDLAIQPHDCARNTT